MHYHGRPRVLDRTKVREIPSSSEGESRRVQETFLL